MAAWLALLPTLGTVLDRLLPDPKAAAEAKIKMIELAQRGDFAELEAATKLALVQADVNKTEAASPGFYRGGWRPAVGWICASGLGYTFLLRPLLPWTAALLGADVPPLPSLDMTELMYLLAGMLGLGAMRTVERIKDKE